MLNSFTYPDAVTMHDSLCRRFMLGKPGEDYNWKGSFEVGMDNLTVGVESFDFNYDLKQLWLTRARWNTMVRQYIDPEALDVTLGMVETYLTKHGTAKRGISTLRMAPPLETEGWAEYTENVSEEIRTKMVKSWMAGRRMSRRWGSCMISLTYRNVPHPTVTLNSRTSYFGFLAMMDVTVAQVFAKMCGDIVGVHPGDMRFVWQLNLAQYHGFRSMAWGLSIPKYKAVLDKYVFRRDEMTARPGLRKTLTGYKVLREHDDAGILYGDETYASRLRMRRRYHTEVMGHDYGDPFVGGTRYPKNGKKAEPLPHLWTADLDFSAIKRGM